MAGTNQHRRRPGVTVLAAVGALLLSGCGQDAAPSADAPAADAPAEGPEGTAAPVTGTEAPADTSASPTAGPDASTGPDDSAAGTTGGAAARTAAEPTRGPAAPPEESAVAEALIFDPWMTVGSPGVGYLFDAEWLIPSWTLNHSGDEPVLVARGVPIGVPVEGVTPQSLVLEDQRDRTVWVTGTPEGRIRLSQQAFPVREGVDGSDYWVTAEVLEPGGGMGGDGMTLLPLQESIPARDVFAVPEPADLPTDATEWEFCLQVAPVPDDVDPTDPRITPQTEGTELLCSDPEPLPEDWATRPAPSGPPTQPPPD